MFSAGAGRVYRIAAGAALLLAVAAIWLVAAHQGLSAERLESILRTRPLLAPAIFVLLHCFAAAAFVPCSPFTLVAGVLWGPGWGLVISVLAAWLSSCLTFAAARYLLGGAWRTRLEDSPPGQALARVSKLGWRGVAFAQLNPVMPASTLGYLFGLSALPLATYAWAVLVFMLPLQVSLVALGGSLRGAWRADGAPLTALALAVGAVLMYVVGKRVTRKLVAGETGDRQNG